MYQKFLTVLLLSSAFAGAMNWLYAAEIDTPQNYARVRVYQQADIMFYPGEYCYGSDNPQAFRAATTGFSIFGTHRREGMPVTDDISGAYNEFRIEAGKAVTVMLRGELEIDGVLTPCGPVAAIFYPQKDKDYDISMGYIGSCFVAIRELFENPSGKASVRMAASSPSYACQYK